MITKNKVVAVSYELKTEPDGDILEKAGADQPGVYLRTRADLGIF